MDRHQRKAKEIYRSCDTEKRVGANCSDGTDSRQESERRQRRMMLPSMAEGYMMTTNDTLHAAKDQRKL